MGYMDDSQNRLESDGEEISSRVGNENPVNETADSLLN
jgi:hypothetical protein